MDYRHTLLVLITVTVATIFLLLWMRRDARLKLDKSLAVEAKKPSNR